jgi:hypothetical protein
MTTKQYRNQFQQEVSDLLYYGKGFNYSDVIHNLPIVTRKNELKRIEDRMKIMYNIEDEKTISFNENMSIDDIKKKKSKFKGATNFSINK